MRAQTKVIGMHRYHWHLRRTKLATVDTCSVNLRWEWSFPEKDMLMIMRGRTGSKSAHCFWDKESCHDVLLVKGNMIDETKRSWATLKGYPVNFSYSILKFTMSEHINRSLKKRRLTNEYRIRSYNPLRPKGGSPNCCTSSEALRAQSCRQWWYRS